MQGIQKSGSGKQGEMAQECSDHNNDGWLVSALMDGEISDEEMQTLLDKMNKDDGVRVAWDRYHQISALLKKQEGACYASAGFAAKVSAALADEPLRQECFDARDDALL